MLPTVGMYIITILLFGYINFRLDKMLSITMYFPTLEFSFQPAGYIREKSNVLARQVLFIFGSLYKVHMCSFCSNCRFYSLFIQVGGFILSLLPEIS